MHPPGWKPPNKGAIQSARPFQIQSQLNTKILESQEADQSGEGSPAKKCSLKTKDQCMGLHACNKTSEYEGKEFGEYHNQEHKGIEIMKQGEEDIERKAKAPENSFFSRYFSFGGLIKSVLQVMSYKSRVEKVADGDEIRLSQCSGEIAGTSRRTCTDFEMSPAMEQTSGNPAMGTSEDKNQGEREADRFELRSRGTCCNAEQNDLKLPEDDNTPLLEKLALVQPDLEQSMHHLLNALTLPAERVDASILYAFLWRRMLVILQDIQSQSVEGMHVATILEQMIRFLVVMTFEFQETTPPTNDFQLDSCLKYLTILFRELFKQYCKLKCAPNKAEFCSYIEILKFYFFQSLNKSASISNPFTMPRGFLLPLNHPEMQFTIQLQAAIKTERFEEYFALFKSASFVQCCFISFSLNKVRSKFLSNVWGKLPVGVAIPVSHFRPVFCLETTQVKAFLESHGIVVFKYLGKGDCFIKHNEKTDFINSWPRKVLPMTPAFIQPLKGSNSISSIVSTCPQFEFKERVFPVHYLPHFAAPTAGKLEEGVANTYPLFSQFVQNQGEPERVVHSETTPRSGPDQKLYPPEAGLKSTVVECQQSSLQTHTLHIEAGNIAAVVGTSLPNKGSNDGAEINPAALRTKLPAATPGIQEGVQEGKEGNGPEAGKLLPTKNDTQMNRKKRADKRKTKRASFLSQQRERSRSTQEPKKGQKRKRTKRHMAPKVNLTRIMQSQMATRLKQGSRSNLVWNVVVLSRILDKGHVGPSEEPRNCNIEFACWLYEMLGNKDSRYFLAGKKPLESFSLTLAGTTAAVPWSNAPTVQLSAKFEDLGFLGSYLPRPFSLQQASGLIFVINPEESMAAERERLSIVLNNLPDSAEAALLVIVPFRSKAVQEGPKTRHFHDNWSVDDVEDFHWEAILQGVEASLKLPEMDRARVRKHSVLLLQKDPDWAVFATEDKIVIGAEASDSPGYPPYDWASQFLRKALLWLAKNAPLSAGSCPTTLGQFLSKYTKRYVQRREHYKWRKANNLAAVLENVNYGAKKALEYVRLSFQQASTAPSRWDRAAGLPNWSNPDRIGFALDILERDLLLPEFEELKQIALNGENLEQVLEVYLGHASEGSLTEQQRQSAARKLVSDMLTPLPEDAASLYSVWQNIFLKILLKVRLPLGIKKTPLLAEIISFPEASFRHFCAECSRTSWEDESQKRKSWDDSALAEEEASAEPMGKRRQMG